jgi:hypothetical protein
LLTCFSLVCVLLLTSTMVQTNVYCKQAPLSCCLPSVWKREDNPAYCWQVSHLLLSELPLHTTFKYSHVLATTSFIAQLYYLWANIEVLNKLRQTKGLNTFAFRPHAGETGDSMHLAATYMLCRSINHGINLDKQVSLQYLYYLDQVGLSVRQVVYASRFCLPCFSVNYASLTSFIALYTQSTFQQLSLSKNQVQSVPKAVQEVCVVSCCCTLYLRCIF